jgi:hypothetical protein
LAGLFIIFYHPQQFRSRLNRRQCKVFTSVLGGFDLRACVCDVGGPWKGRGRAVEGPRGVVHCDKVGAAVLVLVVTVCVGGARLVGGGRCRRSRGCRSALI